MDQIDSPATALDLPTLTLPHCRRALSRDAPSLRITVFGSSTTQGVGASSPASSYPAVMQQAMLRNIPDITLRNLGIGGNNAGDLHDRLDDVIDGAPDLVLFQTGSNDPLQGVPLDRFEQLTCADLTRLRDETAADIILVDQQLCRVLEECDAFPPFLTSLHRIGEALGIPVFPRYRLMQGWCDMPGMDRDTLSPDGLHMGDHGYALLGHALSGWLLPRLAVSPQPPAAADRP